MMNETVTYDTAKLGGLRRKRVTSAFSTKKKPGLRDRLLQMKSAGAFAKGKAC